MDREYIRDNQLIERYLRGRLTAEEEARFEEAYLADPELLDEVKLVERLEQGMKAAAAAGRAAGGPSTGKSGLGSGVYAAAASVLLAISLAFSAVLYRENLSLRRADAGIAGAAGAPLIPLFATRGGPVTMPAPDAADFRTFLLDPAPAEFDEYAVAVSRVSPGAPEPVARVEGLEPSYEELVSVLLPGRLLTPGSYELALEGRMRDWPPERYEQVSRIRLDVEPR